MQSEDLNIFPEITTAYAGFWARFFASLLDGLILLVPNLIVKYAFNSTLLDNDSVLTFVITTAIGWLYFALQESGPRQATPGKRIMEIKVTDVNGSRINVGRATTRYFFKSIYGIAINLGIWFAFPSLQMLVLVVISVFAIFSYAMMLWDSRNQALHDKLAGTLVLTKTSGISAFKS